MITIDCRNCPSSPALHRALAEALSFPDWYGHNLDALYDCLTDLEDEICLQIRHLDVLGEAAAGFRAVFADAQGPGLSILLE